MSEPFLSEIRMVGFNFAPRGWTFCDGQLLPINQNQSLYSLLGTTFGGDGRTSFGLPELRGRSPRKGGSGASNLGQKGGAESVALSAAQMGPHSHPFQVNAGSSDSTTPQGNYLGKDDPATAPTLFADTGGAVVDMEDGSVLDAGGGQAHNNMQPFVAVNFCIALQGLFPSRN